jgi:hypothetical protein
MRISSIGDVRTTRRKEDDRNVSDQCHHPEDSTVTIRLSIGFARCCITTTPSFVEQDDAQELTMASWLMHDERFFSI